MTMDELILRVAAVRRAIRRLFLLDGTGRVLLAVAAAAAFLFAADYALVLPAGARTVMFLLALAGAGLALARYVVYPLRVRIDDDAIVARVERANPALREALLSALQFHRRTDEFSRRLLSQAMVRITVEGALAAAAPLSFGSILRPARAWRTLALGMVAFAAFLAAGAASPDTFSVFLSRVWGGPAKWPPRTILVVESPGSPRTRMAAGEDLVIRVRAEKEIPSRAWVTFRFPATGEGGEVRMTKTEDGRFEFPFPRLVSAVRFRVEGGDARTEDFEVAVLEPPRVEAIRVWLEPPAYTKVPPTPEGQPLADGTIQAPAGTKARVRVESSKPLRSATLAFQPSGTSLPMRRTDAASAESRFDVIRSEHYGIRLLDEEGLENRTPSRFAVQAVPDRRPRITVAKPDSTSLWITPAAALPFECKADDDYGVNRVSLLVVRTSRDHKGLDLPLEPAGPPGEPKSPFGPASAAFVHVLDFSSLEVSGEDAPRRLKEGDLVLVQAAATDFQEPNPNKTTSAEYRLTVVSQGKLEALIEERMIHVKDLLRKAHGEQETVRASVLELRSALAAEEVWDASRREALLGAQTGQRGVGQRLEVAARELERVLDTVLTNRLGDPEYQRKIQEMGQVTRHLAGERTADALAGLEKARAQPAKKDQLQGLADAAQVEQDILRAVADLLERMGKWEDYNEVVKIVREVRDLQDGLRRKTLDEAKEREKEGKK